MSEPTRNVVGSTTLLPCPFCGSRALYEGYHELDEFSRPMETVAEVKVLDL